MGQTAAVREVTVRRVNFGYFVRPAEETGTGQPRADALCLGYLIDHPDGLVLVDTGMGAHPEVDAWYRPRRRDLSDALAGVGVAPGEVGLVARHSSPALRPLRRQPHAHQGGPSSPSARGQS